MMRTLVRADALAPLLANLATCGGTTGPLFRIAQLLKGAQDKETLEEILGFEAPFGLAGLVQLAHQKGRNGNITPELILQYFGGEEHFRKITSEGTMVARELTAEKRALAHLALPLTEGVYHNGPHTIKLEGLVPLGEQTGQLVAHLGGVYACNCPKTVIRKVLSFQHRFLPPEVWMIDRIDYRREAPHLIAETEKAKQELGL